MNKMTIASSTSTEDVVGGSSQNEPPDGDYVEADPMHRYIRYDEVLGRGAFKTVYRGFDEVDGIEIAWNQIRINDVLRSPDDLERLYSEVHLLKSLKHANIIKFYSSWVDDQKKTINIITELFTSGSLRQYRKKHKNVDMKAVKNWARQILCGLYYLHGHNPPIIHRDLKCDNIFVNGNHGEVKIGDLGLATVMQQPNARSVIGTPEFMAPELYDEEYNELVDIYSFGMCLLEMITFEYPYSECNNAAQIYRKVTNGVKPLALGKVKDPQVRMLIEKCLSPASERLSAKELLKDPFFQYVDPREIARHPLKLPAIIPKPLNKGSSSIASDVTTVSTIKTGPLSMDIDFELKPPAIAVTPGPVSGTSTPQQSTALEFERSSKNHDFKLKWEKTDSNTITLVLRIADARGPVKNVHFMFYLDSDTALAVAGEMVEHLEFCSQDVTFIAEFIDFVIMKLVPGWKPSCVDKLPDEANHVFVDSKAAGQDSFGYPWDGVQRSKTMKNEGSDDAFSPSESGNPCAEISSADGSVHQADHGNNAFAKAADMMSQTGVDSSSSLATLEDQELFGSFASDISAEYTQVSTLFRDSTEELDPDMNLNMSGCNLRDISNIPRIQSNASSVEGYDADEELKSELVSIEMQYQQWFRELEKQQEEALQSARKRWEAKKKLRAGG